MKKEISTLLDEILSRIPDSGKYIDVKVNGSNIQIPFKNIIFCGTFFAYDPHSYYQWERIDYSSVLLKHFTVSLKMDSRFLFVQQGNCLLIWNMRFDFDGSKFLMEDDNNIPVSRKLLKNARQIFMEFLFQKGK